MLKPEFPLVLVTKTRSSSKPRTLASSPPVVFRGNSPSHSKRPGHKKLFPTTKAEWDNMNPIKRELCGLAVLAIGIPGTLFMTLVMPKPNIGHALAFERCNRNHIKLEAERWGRGEKQNKEEDRKKAWSHAGRNLMSILWAHLGSKALYVATVHLDPTYKPVKSPLAETETNYQEKVKKAQINMGFFGGIANRIQILLFKFSDKFDIQNEGHYIQPPPPKLSFLDRFLLKHYFKTKPSWEYTEEERLKIAARYRK